MGEASTSAFTFFFVPPVGIAEAFAKKRKKDPRSMWPIEPESSMRNSRCICSVESSWILETRLVHGKDLAETVHLLCQLFFCYQLVGACRRRTPGARSNRRMIR